MLIKTRGIILRSIKYGETSIIADIYTEQQGLRSYIISGVRTAKARYSAGLLQIMSLVDMVAYHRAEKDLNRIKEIKSAYLYQQLPFNIVKSSVGQFMAELAQKTIHEPEQNQALFNFLFHAFQYLDQNPNPVANYHLQFMLQLSGYLGFLPHGIHSESTPYFDQQEGLFLATPPPHRYYLNPNFSAQLSTLLQLDFEHGHECQISKQERKLLLNAIIDYYRLHIDNFPTLHAHEILVTVLG